MILDAVVVMKMQGTMQSTRQCQDSRLEMTKLNALPSLHLWKTHTIYVAINDSITDSRVVTKSYRPAGSHVTFSGSAFGYHQVSSTTLAYNGKKIDINASILNPPPRITHSHSIYNIDFSVLGFTTVKILCKDSVSLHERAESRSVA